ncbi:hypothetical protein [Catalinimonas alkaloidigena]|nr:hypothetical protein [Catalinimonas alkaloidigena]
MTPHNTLPARLLFGWIIAIYLSIGLLVLAAQPFFRMPMLERDTIGLLILGFAAWRVAWMMRHRWQ